MHALLYIDVEYAFFQVDILQYIFLIHSSSCTTISTLFFQTYDGFQLTMVFTHNLLWKSMTKIIQIFNLKTSIYTTVTVWH